MSDEVFAVMLYTRNDTGTLWAIYRTHAEANAGLIEMLHGYGCPGCYLGEVHRRRFGQSSASVLCTFRLSDVGTITETPSPEHYRWPSEEEFEAALEKRRPKS